MFLLKTTCNIDALILLLYTHSVFASVDEINYVFVSDRHSFDTLVEAEGRCSLRTESRSDVSAARSRCVASLKTFGLEVTGRHLNKICLNSSLLWTMVIFFIFYYIFFPDFLYRAVIWLLSTSYRGIGIQTSALHSSLGHRLYCFLYCSNKLK